MTKDELFETWIAMIESGGVTGSNLLHVSLEHRDALRAAFFSGMAAAEIYGVPS